MSYIRVRNMCACVCVCVCVRASVRYSRACVLILTEIGPTNQTTLLRLQQDFPRHFSEPLNAPPTLSTNATLLASDRVSWIDFSCVLSFIRLQFTAETLYKSQWIQRQNACRFVKGDAGQETANNESLAPETSAPLPPKCILALFKLHSHRSDFPDTRRPRPCSVP